jgi:hypothetical protein
LPFELLCISNFWIKGQMLPQMHSAVSQPELTLDVWEYEAGKEYLDSLKKLIASRTRAAGYSFMIPSTGRYLISLLKAPVCASPQLNPLAWY